MRASPASRFVSVGELQDVGGEYVLDVSAGSVLIAEALEFVLPDQVADQGATVTIRVLDPQGNPVTSSVSPADATVEQTKALLRNALGGNIYPVGLTIGELPMSGTTVMVEIQARVISFWDDNMADPNGYDHFVAADAFNEVVDDDLKGLFFTSIRELQ
jgi:hypothetical protein